MPREASIERRCATIALEHDALLVKVHHGIVGLPDRILFPAHAPARWIEFKRPGEVPSRIQSYWHGRLANCGHPVAVIDNIADFKKMLTVPSDRRKV